MLLFLVIFVVCSILDILFIFIYIMCIHPCIMYIISCLCKAHDNVNCVRCCACCSVLWSAFSQQVKLGHWNSWRSLVENLTTLFPQHCKLPCNYSHWGSALSSALTSSHVAKLTVMKPLTPAPNSKCYARCPSWHNVPIYSDLGLAHSCTSLQPHHCKPTETNLWFSWNWTGIRF